MKQIKKNLFFFNLFFLTALLIAVSAEIILRVTDFGIWKIPSIFFDFPTVTEPDPVLGWRNKPGEYFVPAELTKSNDIKITIWPEGIRATQTKKRRGATTKSVSPELVEGSYRSGELPEKTSPKNNFLLSTSIKQNRGKRVLLLGGSFTHGLAISDHETFAWKLQQKFPSIDFLNYGTNGYGTYQSLLTLENYLMSSSKPPLLVIYGFIDYHEERNVAAWSWLKLLSLTTKGPAQVPYCQINNGVLKRQLPESYTIWPFKKHSALINFLNDLYMKLKTRRREFQHRPVTEKLLIEMNTISKKNRSKLLVAMLYAKSRRKLEYTKFFQKEGISFVDCVHPDFDTPAMKVPEGHPNGALNSIWADCIEEAVRTKMP